MDPGEGFTWPQLFKDQGHGEKPAHGKAVHLGAALIGYDKLKLLTRTEPQAAGAIEDDL